MTIKSGAADSFDDRLAIRGSSFILGLDIAFSVILFPILHVFLKSLFLRRVAIGVWLLSFTATAILAPSKSTILSLIFSLLTYRFLLRKLKGSKRKKITGLKQIIFLIPIVVLSALFVVGLTGSSGVLLLINRVAYNYDAAIYFSQLENVSPPQNVFFYGVLPILKQLEPAYREIDFFHISQWLLYERFGIERYGRYGYPNDNLFVGLFASFGLWAALIVPAMFVLTWKLFIARIGKKPIGGISLYFVLLVPGLFASFQDSLIKVYVVLFSWLAFELGFLLLPKKSIGQR